MRCDPSDTIGLDDCLLKSALSGLCVGLTITDNDGKVVWLNHTAEMVLGTPAAECLGQPLGRLLKDLRLSAFWQEAQDTEGNLVSDVVVQWPEKFVLKVNATRYIDDGREMGRALLFCDVTAERDVQVKLSHAVAERLLALTGGNLPTDPVGNLTPQELRILRLLGRGMSNDAIAQEIHVAPSTVRSHLKSVYRKLGLNSRSEAVSYAAREHLV